MKFKKIALVAVLAICLMAILCSCSFILNNNSNNGNNNNENNTVTRVTVNLHVDQTYGYKASDFLDSSTGLTKVPLVEPQKDGYNFVGWYTNSELTSPLVEGVVAPTVLNIYPKYEPKVLNIKINNEAGDNELLKIGYGEVLQIQAPTRDGYVFRGWYTDASCEQSFDISQPIYDEIELYVGWNISTYNINYVLNGGSFGDEEIVETYQITDNITLPNPTKTGYVFNGWYTQPDFSGEKIADLNGDFGKKTFYAKYLCNKAELFAKEGLSEKENGKYVIYTYATEHDIDVRQYFDVSFGGTIAVYKNNEWFGNSISITENSGTGGIKEYEFVLKVTSESTMVTASYSLLIRQYDESTVTVTFIVDSTIYKQETVKKGTMVEPCLPSEKNGYVFVCWENGGEEFDFSTPITSDVTLRASFSAIQYDVVYKLGYGTNHVDNPTKYTIETSDGLLDAVAPDGYTFLGWFTDETYTTEFDGFLGKTDTQTIYAGYTKTALWDFAPTTTEVINGNIVDVYEVGVDAYPRLLDYLVFYGETKVKVIIDGGASQDKEFFAKTYGKIDRTYTLSVSMASDNSDTDTATVILEFSGYVNPTCTSENGTYEQLSFIDFAKDGTRKNYTDFAIDHVQATLSVSTGEQLFFALENGYRPVCEKYSVAEETYSKMREILNGIIGEDFTDKDKALAIVEYLVKEVAYDYAVYDAYLSGETVNDYRSFYLEGAILDKVAVCDGISKAFSALCAIEGIKAIQVDGTNGAVNHAWNKVYLDLNGDGVKEWTAVDCTAVNITMSVSETVKFEGINRTFVFATDDLLTDKNGYTYDGKWYDGDVLAYNAVTVYDIYDETALGDNDYYVTTETELKEIIAFYKQQLATTSDDEILVMEFCADTKLVMTEGKISSVITEALYLAGFTTTEINSIKYYVSNTQIDGQTVISMFICLLGE